MSRVSLRAAARLSLVASLVSIAGAANAQSTAPATAPPPAAGTSPPPAAADATAATPAAPDPDAEKKEQAKQRFLRGLELSQSQDYDAALVEFLASREIFPTRVAILNAATTLIALHRYAESLEMYRELLARFAATIPPDQRKSIDDTMAKLARRVGEITVEGAVAGTRIVVDGQERGSAPLDHPVTVNAGTHSVRAFHEGFLPFEGQVMVAGGEKASVKADLQPMTRSGRLQVTESSGGSFDVIIDGAVAGKTPFEADEPLGPHTVLLRGTDRMGTPPSAAEIEENHTTRLTLQAVLLDATLRVEPSPSNAHVFLDGVNVGSGVWEGAVQHGLHHVDVSAPGFIGERSHVTVDVNKRAVAPITLEQNPNDPMWAAIFRPHIYVSAAVGPSFATGFNGSADSACTGKCSRGVPFGFFGGLRGGYQATSGLGIELFVGYLDLKESMTRHQAATADPHVISLQTDAWHDATRMNGPMAALSASYTFLDKTPLTFRVWAGAARVTAHFQGHGVFNGISRDPSNANQTGNFNINFDLAEQSQDIWVPLVGPEARIGYRFSKHFLIDAGMTLFVMFPAATPRVASDGGPREIPFGTPPGQKYPDGTPIPQPGQVTLPSENGFGTMVAFAPTVGARYDF
ncbi:MAG TPA: PEGA domain-containing protein [Polyangiaceae bacterium]|nr:PEGA domain-containing protein [Polyangiaceae bacterium]